MVANKIRQFLCGLHGHDALLKIDNCRLSLRCTSCGYETPGWDLRSTEELKHDTARRAIAAPLIGELR